MMSLTLIDRFHSSLRRKQQAAIDAGQLHKHEELALLEPTQLTPLALLSLLMFVVGSVFFVGLNYSVYFWQMHTLNPGITPWGAVLWLVINVIGYVLILPIHEAIHGLVFLLWGGKPHFGAKLPLALYCGANNQLFRRNQYLAVGLAPLVVITLTGIILTLSVPVLASYLLLATTGNFAGAAGDVWVAIRLLRQSNQVLIEDTDVGYRVWELPLD